MISFNMPDEEISIFGDSEDSSKKSDKVDPNADVNELLAAGRDKFDLQAMSPSVDGVDLKLDVDELLQNPELEGLGLDTIARLATDGRGVGGEEAVYREIRDMMEANGSGRAGVFLQELGEEVDENTLRYDGSRSSNVSAEYRAEHDGEFEHTGILHEHIHTAEVPEDLHMIGEQHDDQGISDFRMVLGAQVYPYMLENGFEAHELNAAIGTMETLGDLRGAAHSLYGMAAGTAALAGVARFLEELDGSMFSLQAAADPKANINPALGTPEPEPEVPEQTYHPEVQGMEGPNQSMGMAPAAPKGMA